MSHGLSLTGETCPELILVFTLHKVKLWDLWCGAGFFMQDALLLPSQWSQSKAPKKRYAVSYRVVVFVFNTNIGQQEKRAEGLHKHCRTTECDSSGNILQVRSVDTHAFSAPTSWTNDDVQGALVFAES